MSKECSSRKLDLPEDGGKSKKTVTKLYKILALANMGLEEPFEPKVKGCPQKTFFNTPIRFTQAMPLYDSLILLRKDHPKFVFLEFFFCWQCEPFLEFLVADLGPEF